MPEPTIQLQYATPLPKRKWRDRRRGKPLRELLGLGVDAILYSFMALFAIGLCSGLLSLLVGGPLAGFFNVLTGVVLIPVLATAVASIRRRRAVAVIGYLYQAVRLNQPINRVLNAAARSERGRTANRLQVLKDDLEAGLPLSEALAGAVPELPVRTVGLIEFADKTGQLGPTLHRLVDEELNRSRNARNDQAFAAWYPFLMFGLWTAVVSMFCVFVAPKFKQIFADFKVDLPLVFSFVWSLGDWIWIVGLMAALVMLCCLGWQLRRSLRNPPPVWVLSRLRGRIAWNLPLLRGLIRDRNMSDICICLADSLQLGYALDTALTRLAAIELNSVLRHRILNWANYLHGGMNPAEAARRARMPRMLVELLVTTADTPAMVEVLRFVGRFYTDRSAVRREAIRSAIIPVVTVLMGIAVATVALSIFIPLQRLIDSSARGF
jgi:type II secretory pathway component PulF